MQAFSPDRGHTLIIGVLNVTPDSFSDGGQFFNFEAAVAHARQLASEGADIIDLGGESSRPGSDPVSCDEEHRRVLPVLQAIRQEPQLKKIPISIDTCKAEVAERAVAAGADMVNDISALRADARMAPVVAQLSVPVVLMHMLGTPKTMQRNPTYQDVVAEIRTFLQERIDFAVRNGIREESIIIDPGIGFGKKVEHNLQILGRLAEFKSLGRPVLVGTSRKFFIGALTEPAAPPSERLEGTLASSVIAAMNGAAIVRVHDVRATKRALAIVNAVKSVIPQR